TTWEQYEALGLKAAAEHPGYLVGSAGGSWTPEVFLRAGQCPASTLTGVKKVRRWLRGSVGNVRAAGPVGGWPTTGRCARASRGRLPRRHDAGSVRRSP